MATAAPGLRIINFHGVGVPSRSLELGEAPYWLETDRFAWILQRIAAHRDAESIRITFDDGNPSDLAIAAPAMQRLGLAGHFFVLAGRIGLQGSLDISDIRDLASAGMRIGSHGVRHVDWTSLPADVLAEELRSSKSAIEDIVGASVSAAAIPFGRYDASVIRAIPDAGYAEAYSSDGGGASEPCFLKPRTSVTSRMSDAQIDDVLALRMPAGRTLRRWAGMTVKRWV